MLLETEVGIEARTHQGVCERQRRIDPVHSLHRLVPMIPQFYICIPFCPSCIYLISAGSLNCSPVCTNISMTFLKSSVDARAFGSLNSTLSTMAGGGGVSCLVPRDLRKSKNCWTCSVVTICWSGWFVGEVEAISMVTTALTMSMNCWALLNVTMGSDDGFGLLGGVVGCARAV